MTACFTNLPSVLSELCSFPLQLADWSGPDLAIIDAQATAPQHRPSTASSSIKQTGRWLLCYLQTLLSNIKMLHLQAHTATRLLSEIPVRIDL